MTFGRFLALLLITTTISFGVLEILSQRHYHRRSPANGCINNLRQIEGAKRQWALEERMSSNMIPTIDELGPYLRRGNQKKSVTEVEQSMQCPAGGKIIINAVWKSPTCSVSNHFLNPP